MGTIDLYCERTDPSFWAEPLNAATNAAFPVAAWFLWRLARRSGGPDGDVRVLLCLMAGIGIGSALFHTFATSMTRILDELPIALTVLLYVWLYCRRILGMKSVLSTGLLVVALLAAYAGKQFPNLLNGSLMYAPVLLLVTGLGVAHLWQVRRERYDLIAAAGAFVAALFFRTIDNAICSAFPLGTHFLWQVLDAVALYLATRALLANLPITSYRSKTDSSKVSEAGTLATPQWAQLQAQWQQRISCTPKPVFPPITGIKTTRYSAVVRAFLDEYPEAVAELDGQIRTESPTIWCTNSKLRAASNFCLTLEGMDILGFHDGPTNMWVAEEMRPFVQALREKKLLRADRPEPPMRVIGWVWAVRCVILFPLLIVASIPLAFLMAIGLSVRDIVRAVRGWFKPTK
jgi:hypothetical protein